MLDFSASRQEIIEKPSFRYNLTHDILFDKIYNISIEITPNNYAGILDDKYNSVISLNDVEAIHFRDENLLKEYHNTLMSIDVNSKTILNRIKTNVINNHQFKSKIKSLKGKRNQNIYNKITLYFNIIGISFIKNFNLFENSSREEEFSTYSISTVFQQLYNYSLNNESDCNKIPATIKNHLNIPTRKKETKEQDEKFKALINSFDLSSDKHLILEFSDKNFKKYKSVINKDFMNDFSLMKDNLIVFDDFVKKYNLLEYNKISIYIALLLDRYPIKSKLNTDSQKLRSYLLEDCNFKNKQIHLLIILFYTGWYYGYLNIRFNDNVQPDILKKVDDKMYYKIRKLTSLKINPLSPYDKNIYTHLLNIIFDLSIPVKESVELNDFKKSDEFSIDEGTIITSIQLNDFTLKIHRYNIFKDLLNNSNQILKT